MGTLTAFVTGATRGIGRGIALDLARAGYDIAFCFLSSEEEAQSLATEIEIHQRQVLAIKYDLSVLDAIPAIFEQIEQRFGRLDLLVNNAAMIKDGLLSTMSTQDIMSVIQLNLGATLVCCREATKIMIPQRSGNIINISSIASSKPNKGQCNYIASKGGVEASTRALALEVAKKNIRVNCIAPGFIHTDMVSDMLKTHKETIRNKLLSKRYGQPRDISKAVLYLADPENSFVTGEVLQVNGGMMLS